MFDGTFLRRGGTILGTTNKGNPFAFPMPDGTLVDRSEEVIEGWRSLGLDGLIGIGGDGSFAILRRRAEPGGIPLVGVPTPIDHAIGTPQPSVRYNPPVAATAAAIPPLPPPHASQPPP